MKDVGCEGMRLELVESVFVFPKRLGVLVVAVVDVVFVEREKPP